MENFGSMVVAKYRAAILKIKLRATVTKYIYVCIMIILEKNVFWFWNRHKSVLPKISLKISKEARRKTTGSTKFS